MKRPRSIAALLLASVVAGSAWASGVEASTPANDTVVMPAPNVAPSDPRPAPEGVRVPSWAELSPAQKAGLAHLEAHWDRMPASRRVEALERFERRQHFLSLPPEQRRALREGARHFHEMPPELRDRMRRSIRHVQSLPPEQQRALRRQWQALTPEQRRAWLEAGGPGLAPAPTSN